MKYLKQLFTIISFSVLLLACKTEEPIIVTQSISLDKTTLTIVEGDSVELMPTYSPAGSKYISEWTSSNEKVATVNNGVVKALTRGTATIKVMNDSVEASCAVVVTREDLAYQLVWSDEFNGTSLDMAKWSFETGGNGWGNQEKQHYTDRTDNLRFEDGSLIIEAKKEDYGGNSYTSARINTRDKVSFTYGKIEARISLPSGQGTWPAFWMMGSNITYARWPLCGEIDIMEHIGSQPTMLSHAIHTYEKNGSKGNNWSSRNYHDDLEGNYHIYGIEWEEKAIEGDDNISFYIDGVKTATVWEQHVNSDEKMWPFKSDFFILLNLAVGGTMGGTVDDAIFNNPVIMKVDYVRVYQRK